MKPISYLKDTLNELKAVRWPTRRTTIRLTSVVLVISAAVGAYIGSLDFIFTNLLKAIFQ